jgi:hypothetical protein
MYQVEVKKVDGEETRVMFFQEFYKFSVDVFARELNQAYYTTVEAPKEGE